jgi:RNA polymerase sigma factor (sigma-70 family)
MAERAEAAIVTLGRRHRPALLAFFIRHVRNPVEAEDLTQEVLLRLVRLSSEDVTDPDAYIFRIASNLVRDRHRRLQVREAWRTDVIHRDEGAADYFDPLRVLEGHKAVERVVAIISEMPERTRDVLLLFRVDRIRKKEIAETFGISVSAVDKHLIRATAFLAKHLEQDEA